MEALQQYAPYQLRSDTSVTITSPNGKVIILTPFLYQDIELSYTQSGIERITPNSEPYWVVRFYPDQIGDYTIVTSQETIRLSVIAGTKTGFVHQSPQDSRYMCYESGETYFPIGINLAFINSVNDGNGAEFGNSNHRCYLGLRHFERLFRQCAENGVNFVRIWWGHEYLCPDTRQIGQYDLEQFTKLDLLLELAASYGLKVKLTLEQFRFFDYQRKAESNSFSDEVFRIFNKQLYAGERRCESTDEWLFDALWQEAWLDKISQLALRHGGNPTLCAVELWNEMNCIPHAVPWNKVMLPKVKALFPRQLVVNSLGSLDSHFARNCYMEFPWEESDLVQMHRYLDGGAPDEICHHSLMDLLQDGMAILPKSKPVLVAETGCVDACHSGPFRYYSADHNGLLFCDAVYSPIFFGSCGCGNFWHWDERYVEAKNLYPYFRPLTALTEGVDCQSEGFVSKRIDTPDAVLLLLIGQTTVLGYLRNKQDNWERLYRDLEQPITVNANFSLPFDGVLQPIRVWQDETATLTQRPQALCVEDLQHGLLLRWKRS